MWRWCTACRGSTGPRCGPRISGAERRWRSLHAAKVHSTDLRGGAALVVAALGAEGVSQVSGLEHIRRGYEDLEGQLTALGAQVRLIH